MERYLIHDFGKEPGEKNGRDYAREPIIRRMRDGRIVCTFLTGGPTEPHDSNVLKLSYSDDDGKTWSKPEVIISHKNRGVWCTELFNEGRIPFLVVMTYCSENHYRELQTFRSYSDDNGRTWKEPRSFPSGLNGVTLRQGIVMSNGEWLFPLYWQEVVRGFDWNNYSSLSDLECQADEKVNGEPWPFCCGIAVSSDQGETYQRYGYMKDPGNKSLWEPNCIELEKGHIVILMRDNANSYLRRCDSYDYGRTWGELTVTDLPNPNTKLTLLKINDKILLINNFHNVSGWMERTHLEIWVSADNMRTWSQKVPIAHSDDRFFYPHAFTDEKQRKLYVAYENAEQHYLMHIPYDELDV